LVLASVLLLQGGAALADSPVGPIVMGIYAQNDDDAVGWIAANFEFRIEKEVVNDVANLKIGSLDCEAAAEPAATAERLVQGQGSALYNAWLAWGYQACGRQDLYGQSIERLEHILQSDPDVTGLGFYQMLEGDREGLIATMQQIVANHSPLAIYLQLYLLDTLDGALQGRLATDPRVRELIRGLNFPPNKWVNLN
jgi:hypothetical protein